MPRRSEFLPGHSVVAVIPIGTRGDICWNTLNLACPRVVDTQEEIVSLHAPYVFGDLIIIERDPDMPKIIEPVDPMVTVDRFLALKRVQII